MQKAGMFFFLKSQISNLKFQISNFKSPQAQKSGGQWRRHPSAVPRSTIFENFGVLPRISAIIAWPRGDLPIFDCQLLMDIGRSCYTTFSIVNRQSAMKAWFWGCDRRPRFSLLPLEGGGA
jgi:hypothetical protein